MKKHLLYYVVLLGISLILGLSLIGCSSDNTTNPTGGGSGNNSGNDTNPPKSGGGFGVSGLLFENNLVMWFRENSGDRSELFPQMYFTRVDAANFPVWGTFPIDQVVSGGVPRDGILALVEPRFVQPNSSELSYLSDSDLVLGAVINGQAKAYPENIFWWHEIANDIIGGVPVIMTLCPLTGTGLLFRAPADGNTVDQLELLPVIETTWEMWKQLYPETIVISENAGNRNYSLYPYGGYRNENSSPLFPIATRPIDRRYPPKHTVLGLLVGEAQKAYPFARLEEKPVVNDHVNGTDVLIVSDLNARLAIPYDRAVNGQVLSFNLNSEDPFQMKDSKTGSVWNIKGEAISGQLVGTRLKQISAYTAFWFAWSTFWPQSQVFEN